MSLINKIKGSIEDTGLTCLYDSAGDINRLLDYQNYPLAFFTLINRGGLISFNGVYREIANVVVFFVNTSTFDFDSLENEEIIKTCKTLALTWLDTLPRNGVLKATVLDTNRVYNYADSILTVYCLNLRIEELEGEGCLNPLIPDDRKCEVLVSTEEGGTVEGSGTYILNTTCTISATPDSSHRFSGWYIGEDLISTEPTYTFTITESGTLNINGKFEARKLVVNTDGINVSFYLTSSTMPYDYLWHCASAGENIYTGNVPGYELGNITAFRVASSYSTLTSFDASDLTSWTQVAPQAFDVSKMLTTAILPDSIEYIHQLAFQDCIELSSINLPEGLLEIGYQSFANCTALKSITFPSTLHTINTEAFIRAGLESITIPVSVNSIGGGAFQNCTSLTSITCLSTTPPYMTGSNTFVNTNDCPIYVPADSVNAYKTSSRWSSYASRIQAITE